MSKLLNILAPAAALLLAASCSHSSEWHVKGNVEGGADKTMLLEASSNGRWYPIDTVTIASNGSFEASQPAAGYPDIYRLNLDGKTIYFPIDSIETVTVSTKAGAFDTDYTVEGTASADMLMNVDNRIQQAINAHNSGDLTADTSLKHDLTETLLADPSGIVAYYIICKSVNGRPIFSPAVKSDLRIIGAVANAYSEQRPADPRTTYLKNLFLSNKPRNITVNDSITAGEIGYFNIDLFDARGQKQSLEALAEKKPVVLLNFTSFSETFSPGLNVTLNKLYDRYSSQGLGIYQVALDSDEYKWRQAAKNLPWISVYNSQAEGESALVQYNVYVLPTFFIIKDDTVAERITNPADLEKAVAKYF